MEDELIYLDTSILIDYFRKTDKANSFFYKLTQKYWLFAVSTITEYEIYLGSNTEQNKFWNPIFQYFTILSFDSAASNEAVKIYKELKSKSQLIDTADILIAAIARSNHLKLATLNENHFSRIDDLELITP